MFKNWKFFIGLALVVVFLASCSEYQKLLKSSDFELKYKRAKEYYEKKDYYKASALFEELINIYKGTARGEEVYYYYTYCQYSLQEYIMAAYHFKFFAKNFPNSRHVEEAEYLSSFCIYLESPEYSLDQMYTYKAIESFQLYLDKYPLSSRVDSCNKIIDVLRAKLEKKAYHGSTLYYKLGDYKAAIIALKNMMKEYPDSQYREEIMYLILKSCYLLAENSIEKKKKERYQNTLNEYYILIDEYPTSKYIKEAESMFTSSSKKIKNYQ
ncbi:MAG: hypothetical protein A2275_02575 [Bacteroidetes bacterium RIFOXYA12_FULL_35_11]|nr:MAG: hypothetical protein A2X01_06985 [Bacteroidetes bacterium GWF2_35_48]OFY82086.1 MAG: hypothetical protein A2275_02575 [Bacteroidetes bacterium RIFOXYA12_FULL_35_11]OFY94856.1 MAG: hypothetical protein A2491_20060 [Bacteroidetes bacterium RIFOXYC12_FULL_35_7]OFY97784.1 MAG: hypothetical protein A2309_08540 [Bacteroidetes bacterium RIFOXYB2_FULL_35_7]HBX53130.1 outer membrane protein assembly factor BamD [Bacteroidales bacterium]